MTCQKCGGLVVYVLGVPAMDDPDETKCLQCGFRGWPRQPTADDMLGLAAPRTYRRVSGPKRAGECRLCRAYAVPQRRLCERHLARASYHTKNYVAKKAARARGLSDGADRTARAKGDGHGFYMDRRAASEIQSHLCREARGEGDAVEVQGERAGTPAGQPTGARQPSEHAARCLYHYKEAKKIGVNDEDIVSATSGSRLIYENGGWHYLTGQYYPVEYRGAIKRAIEDAIAKNRQDNAASVPVPDFRTVEDVKRYSKKIGRYYFHPDTVKYFRSIIHTRTLIHGRYFIESTQRTDDAPRMYKVLAVNRASGSIEHLDHIGEFLTYPEALEAVPVT